MAGSNVVISVKAEYEGFKKSLQEATKVYESEVQKMANLTKELANQKEKLNNSKANVQAENDSLKILKEQLKVKSAESSLDKQQIDNIKQQIIAQQSLVNEKKRELAEAQKIYDQTRASKAEQQATINSQKVLMRGLTQETNQAYKAVQGFNKAVPLDKDTNKEYFNNFIRHIRQIETATVGLYMFKKAIEETVGAGFKLNAELETSSLGMAVLIANKIADVQQDGKRLDASEKLRLGQQMSLGVMQDIRKASLDTTASIDTLAKMYRNTIGNALVQGQSWGKNWQEINSNVVFFIKNMATLGTSMGMAEDKLMQEVRSFSQGDVTADSDLAILLFGSPAKANKKLKELQSRAGAMADYIRTAFAVIAQSSEVDTTQKRLALLHKTIQDIQMSSADMYKAPVDTLIGTFTQYLQNNKGDIVNAFHELNTAMMETLDIFMKIGEGVAPVAKGLFEATNMTREFMVALADTSIGKFLLEIGGAGLAINTLVKSFTVLSASTIGLSALSSLRYEMVLLSRFASISGSAIDVLSASIYRLNLAIKANPLMWAITGASVVVGAMSFFSDAGKDVDSLTEKIKKAEDEQKKYNSLTGVQKERYDIKKLESEIADLHEKQKNATWAQNQALEDQLKLRNDNLEKLKESNRITSQTQINQSEINRASTLAPLFKVYQDAKNKGQTSIQTQIGEQISKAGYGSLLTGSNVEITLANYIKERAGVIDKLNTNTTFQSPDAQAKKESEIRDALSQQLKEALSASEQAVMKKYGETNDPVEIAKRTLEIENKKLDILKEYSTKENGILKLQDDINKSGTQIIADNTKLLTERYNETEKLAILNEEFDKAQQVVQEAREKGLISEVQLKEQLKKIEDDRYKKAKESRDLVDLNAQINDPLYRLRQNIKVLSGAGIAEATTGLAGESDLQKAQNILKAKQDRINMYSQIGVYVSGKIVDGIKSGDWNSVGTAIVGEIGTALMASGDPYAMVAGALIEGISAWVEADKKAKDDLAKALLSHNETYNQLKVSITNVNEVEKARLDLTTAQNKVSDKSVLSLRDWLNTNKDFSKMTADQITAWDELGKQLGDVQKAVEALNTANQDYIQQQLSFENQIKTQTKSSVQTFKDLAISLKSLAITGQDTINSINKLSMSEADQMAYNVKKYNEAKAKFKSLFDSSGKLIAGKESDLTNAYNDINSIATTLGESLNTMGDTGKLKSLTSDLQGMQDILSANSNDLIETINTNFADTITALQTGNIVQALNDIKGDTSSEGIKNALATANLTDIQKNLIYGKLKTSGLASTSSEADTLITSVENLLSTHGKESISTMSISELSQAKSALQALGLYTPDLQSAMNYQAQAIHDSKVQQAQANYDSGVNNAKSMYSNINVLDSVLAMFGASGNINAYNAQLATNTQLLATLNASKSEQVPKFYTGGFTPNAGTYTPTGIVHGGEYVASQQQVQQLPFIFQALNSMLGGNMPTVAINGSVPSDDRTLGLLETLNKNISDMLYYAKQNYVLTTGGAGIQVKAV